MVPDSKRFIAVLSQNVKGDAYQLPDHRQFFYASNDLAM